MTAILNWAWTHAEYRPWIVVLVLRAFAGIHLSEIMCLKWRQISLVGVVDVQESAIGKHSPRLVKLCPAAFTWVIKELQKAERENRLDMPVFPGQKAEVLPSVAEPSLRRKFEILYVRLCAAAKVPKISNGLRRAFASHAFRLTYNPKWTKDQMGSHKIDLFDFYIALGLSMEEAQKYLAIAHPDVMEMCKDLTLPADYDLNRWLPPKICLTEDDARDAYNDAVATAKADKGKHSN